MRSALVLNATYEPLSIVSVRRAVCLVLAEKADLLHDDGTELHAARVTRARAARDPAPLHREGAVPPAHRAQPASGVRPRRPPLPVLRRARRLDRPRRAPQPGRRARVGQRRRRLPAVQPAQARPLARGGRACGSITTRPRRGSWPGWWCRSAGCPRRGSRTWPTRRELRPTVWSVERRSGSAADFHGRELPDPVTPGGVGVRGRRRPPSSSGPRSGPRSCGPMPGIEVVRRRSGGGAVLLVPGEVLWVDVVVPRGDPLWDDDVGRASHWLGEVWVEALAAVGVAGTEVHDGGLVCTPWCSLVCFAGLGPGEVTIGGAKARRHQPAPHPGRGAVPVRGPPALGPGGRRRRPGRARRRPSPDELPRPGARRRCSP